MDLQFEQNLRSCDPALSDAQLRQIVYQYCVEYQECYEYEQLEDTFEYLHTQHNRAGLTDFTGELLPLIIEEVELAMGEYFESLNEVATAVHRLFDPRPFTVSDAIKCVKHVLRGHELNEIGFEDREDLALCSILERVAANHT